MISLRRPRIGNRPIEIEAVICGRNDDYEPGWHEVVQKTIDYNHRQAKTFGISWKTLFVEWNPLPERPLVSSLLASSCPEVRCVVVPRTVHARIGTNPEVPLLLNFAWNTGLRRTSAPYVSLMTADVFVGTDVFSHISDQGLQPRTLYRAERRHVDRSLLQIPILGSQQIEDPERCVGVDSCSEPPFDKPPYTNACGDFLLLDRETATESRGYDESVKGGRIHLDSRFAYNLLCAGVDVKLIGKIYHVDHEKSYARYQDRRNRYIGELTSPLRGFPYVNSQTWGLGNFGQTSVSDRITALSDQVDDPPGLHDRDSPIGEITRRLLKSSAETQPELPSAATTTKAIDLQFGVEETWDGLVCTSDTGETTVFTAPDPWAYSAMGMVSEPLPANSWSWIELIAEVTEGSIGIGLLDSEGLEDEILLAASEGPRSVFLRIYREGQAVLVRNADAGYPSAVRISRSKLHSQPITAPQY